MLNDEIVKLANNHIKLEIAEEIKRLKKDVVHCMTELAPLGLSDSSVARDKISELCTNTILNCAQLTWQTLFRFIAASGIKYSEELAPELKDIVKSHLPENLDNISECIQPFRMEFLLEGNLRNTRTHALRKIETEIDLFVQSLKNQESVVETQTQSNIFNINSSIGAIQTGEGAMANVSQHIDSEIKENLMKILVSLEQSIRQIASLPNYPKDEIIKLIHDSQNEIQKERSNFTKLRTLLTTVGTSIQLVGSLKPAYDNLKTILSFLGISLP